MEKGAERDGVVDPGWATRERGGMKSSVHGRFDESDYVEWECTAGTEIEAERLDVDERAAPFGWDGEEQCVAGYAGPFQGTKSCTTDGSFAAVPSR